MREMCGTLTKCLFRKFLMRYHPLIARLEVCFSKTRFFRKNLKIPDIKNPVILSGRLPIFFSQDILK